MYLMYCYIGVYIFKGEFWLFFLGLFYSLELYGEFFEFLDIIGKGGKLLFGDLFDVYIFRY